MADKSGRPVDIFAEDDDSFAGRLRKRREAIENMEPDKADEAFRGEDTDSKPVQTGPRSIEEDYDSDKPLLRRYKTRGYRTLSD
jgi:hypothetical protein